MAIYLESFPDWGAWGDLRTIRLIDAIVLSLGVCPNWLNHTNQINPTHPVFTEIKGELMRRVKVASNRAGEFDRWAAIYPEHQRIEANINIAEYANWATSVMSWEVPQEFSALAHANKTESRPTIPQAVATAPEQITTSNKLKTKKAHPLRSLIDIAKTKAINPESNIDVWSQLVSLVEIKPPPPPVIEITEGEIKYQVCGEAKLFSYKNLRDMLDREKK